ncbi:MAG: type II toxin-antitoxin system ParD family antitoxin [Dokdonella sp.]
MATMNISLPDELKGFVDEQVTEHGYSSSSEYLRELIRKERDVAKLRAMLLEGANSGPGDIADEEFFTELRLIAKGEVQA